MAAPISMGEMKCSLSNFSSISCGYHRNYLKELIITKISECNRDITSHIRRYKLNSCDVKSEGHLICFRGGLFQFENFETWTICPAHRYSLGLQWRPQYKKCMYPYHSGGRRPTRTVGVAMSHHLLQTTGHLVPIGSGLCTQCVNLWNKLKATASEQQNESNIPDIDEEETRVASEEPRPQTSLIEVTSTSASYGGDLDSEQYSYSEDQSQTCSQLSNWSTEENIPLDKINNFIQYMGGGSVSPLKSQLSKPLDDCTGKTQSYYKRKAEEVFQLVSEGIAPGQGKVLSETVLGTNKTENEEVENETENCIMKLYEESSDGSVKTQLLSLIANKYKKKYLLNKYPVLTKFAIDKARKFAASGEIQDNTTKFRQKMSPQQIEHALDFFSNPTFNQVLAFGNKTLKLESGEKLEILCVVRTSLHSNMISIYNKYCLETNFNPLSKSTLYNILNVCSASKQKSMKGLDNIASDGAYGFDSLENIVEKLDKTVEWKKEIKLCLRQSKTYLKSEFKLHIKDNSECPDHCLSWALSDENTKFRSTCQHEHNVSCNFCDLLKSTTDSICTAVQDLTDKKEEIETDFKRAVENVTEWKAHIMRTVNQDRGRQELLETMKPNQVLVIMDWAMKFLPMFFREKQKDWFGQKGRHWHVIVVIHKDEAGNYKHRTFTHVMDMVKQDYYAVASLLEHVLASLRVQLPEVDEAFLRSDNAACYHSGFLWTILPDISSRTEIKIRRFDYSEPQSGKSYCDAKIAHMRLKMRMFVAEKHDVTTAAEMKTAIDSKDGVAGCQVAVVAVDTSRQNVFSHKFQKVTQINNLEYLESGDIRYWKSYGIGQGDVISCTKYKTDNAVQANMDLSIMDDFRVPSKIEGIIQVKKDVTDTDSATVQKDPQTEGLFPCPEFGCSQVFVSASDLENHVLLGCRINECSYDTIKRKWAEKCHNLSNSLHVNLSEGNDENPRKVIRSEPMGWAQKKDRKKSRFTSNVKSYLSDIFSDGQKSGKKASPVEVSQDMRCARSDGVLRFSPAEWLQPTQIASYFSRLSLLNRKGKTVTKQAKAEIDDEEMENILQAIEYSELRENVYQNLVA